MISLRETAPSSSTMVRTACAALLGLALQGAALAQSPAETVTWSVAAPSAESVKPGDKVQITLRGAVLDGWHVYGLEQPQSGPIPLKVTLGEGAIAAADGVPNASPPEKVFDTSFKLDTQYYSKDFTVSLPVRIAADVAPGPQQVPVSVRYQTCNGKICHPPKTVRLTAPVNVRKAG